MIVDTSIETIIMLLYVSTL